MISFNVDLSSVKGHKDLFKQLAAFTEVFSDESCGKCKSGDVAYVVRNVEDNDFYEKKCKSCGAKLAFGSHKKGDTLFPKRKDGDSWLLDSGWVKYNRETNKEE